jgi:putative colanic acid biosynthesis UDP-glucose lipid carrier transferase
MRQNSLKLKFTQYIQFTFIIIDLILINMGIFIFNLNYFQFDAINKKNLAFYLYINIIWIILTKIFQPYKLKRYETAGDILIRTVRNLIIFVLVIFLDVEFLHPSNVQKSFIYIYLPYIFSSIFIFRIIGIYLLKKLRKKGFNNKKVLIIGSSKNMSELIIFLNKELSFGYSVIKQFEYPNQNEQELEIIKDFCHTEKIDEIFLTTEDSNPIITRKIIKFCDSNFIRFKLVPNFQDFALRRKVNITFFKDIAVLKLRKEPLENIYNRFQKRIFDIIFSLIIITTIFPWLFPIIFIIQKITSKGPAFFIQKRSGQGNQEFNCLKFRTMYENIYSNQKGTEKNDVRITKFGNFLRKTRIDELPQFINVLFGQMSVVGPRPHMIKHTVEYSKLIDEFLVRHFVKPGITGWAQTTGYIDESRKLQEMSDKVKKDVWYIENWTFLLDLKIIGLTIVKIFKKDINAY